VGGKQKSSPGTRTFAGFLKKPLEVRRTFGTLNSKMPRSNSRRAAEPSAAPLPVLPVRDSVVFPGMVHTLQAVRESSRKAVRGALAESGRVFVVAQREGLVEEPGAADLYSVGTICEVLQSAPLPDGSLRVALRGEARAQAERFSSRAGSLRAKCAQIREEPDAGIEAEALSRSCLDAFTDVLERSRAIPEEALDTVNHQPDAGTLADAIAHHLPLRASLKQELLEQPSHLERLQTVHTHLLREAHVLRAQAEILEKVDREFATLQRELFLKEQLRAVQAELEQHGEGASETRLLREQIEAAQLPHPVREKALAEIQRLERSAGPSPEAMVIRGYLDWLLSLPWRVSTPDSLDLEEARRVLDDAHFGLEPVKERILDFLAVRKLSRSLRGPILCFVGPPGVGKTSIGRSIADALGRSFARISLGGLRDEAELRGHRRTYVGAMPGRILQCLRQCGSRNPVILLDEIDKMAGDYRGDPGSVLLEALDPAQNERFEDHYLELPFDLSGVLFLATANWVDGLPHALRDRMEVVPFPSYTNEERLEIAHRFILPRQRDSHGLQPGQLSFTAGAMRRLAEEYTQEAGVRDLERTIAAVCRKSARRIAEGRAASVRVSDRSLHSWLGAPRTPVLAASPAAEAGVAVGLVVTPYGGATIPIEVLLLPPSRGAASMRLTGNLGAVMRESAETAASFVRSIQARLAPNADVDRDVHIHAPENAIPKEGPSAGLTIVAALASALSGRPLRAGIALSGEISLRGRVMPVGGVRDKLVAAKRAGIREVILPAGNLPDLADVPKSVLRSLKVHLVKHADEALRIALGLDAPRAGVHAVTRIGEAPGSRIT
jgi:ATP-dependent Lon protease